MALADSSAAGANGGKIPSVDECAAVQLLAGIVAALCAEGEGEAGLGADCDRLSLSAIVPYLVEIADKGS